MEFSQEIVSVPILRFPFEGEIVKVAAVVFVENRKAVLGAMQRGKAAPDYDWWYVAAKTRGSKERLEQLLQMHKKYQPVGVAMPDDTWLYITEKEGQEEAAEQVCEYVLRELRRKERVNQRLRKAMGKPN